MNEGQSGAALHQLRALIGTQAAGDQSDGQLLERFAVHREAAAFTALIQRHGPMVFGLCRRVLRDHHQAEDAFQATFLVLVRKAPSLDRRRPLGNWLYTIAYHAALKARTSAARRLRREARAIRPDCVDARDEFESAELRLLLDAEVRRLPDKYRAPVILCYLQGRTNEEAAQELGWPSGTVKGRLARARNLLQDRLAKRGLTLSVPVPAGTVSLSPALMEHTVEAASSFANKTLVANRATPLALAVLRGMMFTKIKKAAILVLAAVVVTSGLGFWMMGANADHSRAGSQAGQPKDPLRGPLLDNGEAKAPHTSADQPADREPANRPVDKEQRVLLDELAPIKLGPEKRPALTIGRVVEKGRKGTLLEGFQNDALEFTGPTPDQPAMAFAVSPVLNSGENANVVSVSRVKNVFTLVMDVWRDDTVDRAKNIVHRKAFQVNLGILEAGEYEFRLIQRHMFMDIEKRPWSKFKSKSEGTAKFVVRIPDGNRESRAVLLREDEVRELREKSEAFGTTWQDSEYETKVVPSGIPAGIALPRVEIGTADFKSWQGSNPLKLENLPKLREPEKGEPVYLTILGPVLNTAEALTLREIEWRDQEAIVHVDLWRDTGPRFANALTTPYLVIPLHAPTGDYHIKVKWTFLMAPQYPQPGQVYTEIDPAKFGDKEPLKGYETRSEATATIK
jgi:RNA polymerase sigma factor (sigma-70 family)